jgi:hypothetical protein
MLRSKRVGKVRILVVVGAAAALGPGVAHRSGGHSLSFATCPSWCQSSLRLA